MKRRAVPLSLCLILAVSAGCDRGGDREKIESLEREVRSLKLQLGASAEQRAAELAEGRVEREEQQRQDSGRIADLERALAAANAKIDVLKNLQANRSEDIDLEEPEETPNSAAANPFGSAADGAPSAPSTPSPAARKRLSVDAVVLIVGDQSQGTGCIIREGTKHYLYTAAHVLSGNTRLTVTNAEGRKFNKFGDLETAEGADLVRLRMFDDDPGEALELADSESSIAVGAEISVLGNGGGEGVIAAEEGKILGLGTDSIEVDAEIIQGNSGGPVVIRRNGRVAGIVTHLTAKREDIWAQGTRFGDVRRFACRVDRSWEWTTLPLSSFLAQSREVAEYDRLTRVALAIGALHPTTAGLRLDTQLAENITALSILTEAEDMPVVASLIQMNNELSSRKMRSSDADLRRRFRSLIAAAISEVSRQGANLSPAKMSWLHRKEAEESIAWRKKAIETLKSRFDSLSN